MFYASSRSWGTTLLSDPMHVWFAIQLSKSERTAGAACAAAGRDVVTEVPGRCQARFVTFFRGAPGRRSDLPSSCWPGSRPRRLRPMSGKGWVRVLSFPIDGVPCALNACGRGHVRDGRRFLSQLSASSSAERGVPCTAQSGACQPCRAFGRCGNVAGCAPACSASP